MAYPPERIVRRTGNSAEVLQLLAAEAPARRPRARFEDRDRPELAGIVRACGPIGIAGGADALPAVDRHEAARHRIVAPGAVIAAAPEPSPASRYGKRVGPGREAFRAAGRGRVHEIGRTRVARRAPAAPAAPGAPTARLGALRAAPFPDAVMAAVGMPALPFAWSRTCSGGLAEIERADCRPPPGAAR